jgi:rhomboid protease GluP
MGSILERMVASPTADNSDAGENPPAATEDRQLLPAPKPRSYEDRLRPLTRWTPITWMLAAANVALFASMALTHERLSHFGSYILLNWGGGLAPRVFGAEWWRAVSHMFVHANLAHLTTNLLFLLLMAPLVERLLGSTRFAVVYLFAGLGGGLLALGTLPQGVAVGASAAVYGVYGALLGCCLRGPWTIPWGEITRRAGLLLLFTAISLLGEWLDFTSHPAAHLGGFVFGLAGGLLSGIQLDSRRKRWKLVRLALVTACCAGLIGLTAWWVQRCAAKALTYYERIATARDRERALLGQFDDALRQWEQGKISSTEWKLVLENTLIPAWQEVRSSCGLKLTGKLAELEQQNFTMQEFWSATRSAQGKGTGSAAKPLTIEEYSKSYSLHSKLRLNTWRALARDLPGNHLLTIRALMDDRELELLSAALDDEVNEDNPLFNWFEMRRGSRRRLKKDGPTAQNLIKNPGFEDGIKEWSPFVVGPPPRVELDRNLAWEGRVALRVSASAPTDTRCTQEVLLKPGRRYRFSGWVRTRGLVSQGATVYGTYQIHARAINNIITKGTNHGGDTDWTEVRLEFQAPADGLIRIVVYFASFGPGTGTAWFDDLKLVEVSQPAR